MFLVYWNKAALARGVEITPQYMYKIEKGERSLSLNKKKNLRDFYQEKANLLLKEVEHLDKEISGKF